MTSNLTTWLSKSAFMDLFPRSDIFMFFAQWVSHPCVLKPLIYQGFRTSCYFTLVINTTVSTWNDRSILMSGHRGSRCLYVETYQGDFTFAETVPKAHSYLYYMQQGIWAFFAIVSTLIFNVSTCRSCCKICNNWNVYCSFWTVSNSATVHSNSFRLILFLQFSKNLS